MSHLPKRIALESSSVHKENLDVIEQAAEQAAQAVFDELEEKVCEIISGKRHSDQPRNDIEERIRVWVRDEIEKATHSKRKFWMKVLLLPLIVGVLLTILRYIMNK